MTESWRVDYAQYEKEISGFAYAEAVEYLIGHLKWCWHDAYVDNTHFKTSIMESPEGTFTYLFDTEVVEEGDLSLKTGRLVAVYGTVRSDGSMRFTSAQLRGRCIGPTEKWIGKVDKGHFIAHSLGGGSNMNIFPQVRAVNRGWSEAGRRYRAMERYAAQNPGMMVFSRPLYSEGTFWPRYIEFGLLEPDLKLRVEVFDNEQPAGSVI